MSTELLPTRIHEVASLLSARYWENIAAEYAWHTISWVIDADDYNLNYPEHFHNALNHLYHTMHDHLDTARFDRNMVRLYGDKIEFNRRIYGSPLGPNQGAAS